MVEKAKMETTGKALLVTYALGRALTIPLLSPSQLFWPYSVDFRLPCLKNSPKGLITKHDFFPLSPPCPVFLCCCFFSSRNGLILLNVKQLRSLMVTDKAELAVSAEFFIHLEVVSLSVLGEDVKGWLVSWKRFHFLFGLAKQSWHFYARCDAQRTKRHCCLAMGPDSHTGWVTCLGWPRSSVNPAAPGRLTWWTLKGRKEVKMKDWYPAGWERGMRWAEEARAHCVLTVVDFDFWALTFPTLSEGGRPSRVERTCPSLWRVPGNQLLPLVPSGAWHVFLDQRDLFLY